MYIKNKKGQVLQIVIMMSVLLVLSFTAVMTYYIIDKFYIGMHTAGITTAEINKTEVTIRATSSVVDYSLIFLMVSLIGGLIISSFLIPSHPIFMAINVLGIFILVFVGMIMTNVYGTMVSGEAAIANNISGIADQFPISNYMISYLPFFAAGILAIVSIVMFAKGRSDNAGGQY